jgi:15-cis-phytoene desaturase
MSRKVFDRVRDIESYGASSTRDPQGIKVDAVIVGGGIAGLTAGVALAEAGVKVMVIEKQSILGGRARSWTDPKTGDPVHIGPHILLSEYANFLGLLDNLGTKSKVVWQPSPHFITMVDGTRATKMKLANLPPPMPFLPSVLMDRGIGLADKLSNFRFTAFAMKLDEEDIYAFDGVDGKTLLSAMGVTDAYMTHFWEFVSMSILNVPLDRVSGAALLRFYRRLIGRRHTQVGFADGGLGDLFAPAARAKIERLGGRVMTGAGVKTFIVDENLRRVGGVVLEDGTRISAARTISALAPQELARLVPDGWKTRKPFSDLAKFEPCPYVSTYLWFDRKVSNEQFWARVHRTDDLNCDFYDLSNIHTGWRGRNSVIATNAIWSHRTKGMTDEQIIERTRAELTEYLPQVKHAKLVHSVVNHIPMAIHCPYPGTESLRPRADTPIGGLLLAGDWTRTEYPSSMESAAFSGYVAAERVLEAQGVLKRLARPRKDVEGFTKLFTRAAAASRRIFPGKIPALVDV